MIPVLYNKISVLLPLYKHGALKHLKAPVCFESQCLIFGVVLSHSVFVDVVNISREIQNMIRSPNVG